MFPENYQKRNRPIHFIEWFCETEGLEFGNYYLKWYDKSYWVRQKEIPELKRFLKNITRHLSVIYHLLNSLENKRPKDKYCAYRQLSPDIHLSHSNRNRLIRYDLHMMLDGSTFIDRTEKIEISLILPGLTLFY